MARKKTADFARDDEPGLNISPLIDVAFLLICYFLVTSTLQPSEADLGVTLPSTTASNTPTEIEPLKITIDPELNVFVGPELVDSDPSDHSLPGLTGKVVEYRNLLSGLGAQPIVVVAADDKSKHQRFTDVINTLAEADITTVTLTGFTEE